MLFRYLQRGLAAGREEAEALARELGVSAVTAGILIGRGVATPEAARAFFHPGPERLRDPFGLLGMPQAAERLEQAIGEGERIVVYGDYDVDGVCATSILTGFLRNMGAEADYYIPNRHTEGYGLNRSAIESLKGTDLLVTVDCGVSNAAEVALARSLGMDVIVTDHHECPEELPDCVAVVNPKRPGQEYGFTGLCGAGVALKLVHALGGMEEAELALDLAALATVADIVPLTDENRAIVRLGLELINRGFRPGVKALREVSGLGERPVKAGSIAFALAPRINAGGRMDLSRKSVEMMLTEDEAKAGQIARELDSDNAERVKVEEGILKEAVQMIESGYSFSKRRAIVLYQPHWNTGVTGIVASKVVERYGRPAFLFGQGEGACYGSGRSIPGVHLYNAMKARPDWFLRYGGHEQAAGCALLEENIETFAQALDAYLAETYAEDVFLPSRHYDAALQLPELDAGLARDIEALEPCGFGNPRPVFLLKDVGLAGLSRTADEKHLRMRFGGRDGVEGIAFRQGGMYEALEGCACCDALVVPDLNEWMGRQRVQAVVEHLRLPQGAEAARAQIGSAGPAFGRALANALRLDGGAERPARRAGHAEGMALLTDAVKRSCWGTLALCFTAAGAEAALAALAQAGCAERLYAGVGQARQAARRENALVFAPDLDKLPLQNYDAVFVIDGSLAGGAAGWISSRLNKDAACIIMDEEYAGEIPDFAGREALLRVYRAMKARLAQGAGPRARGDWEWLAEPDGIPPWGAELAARIFAELGLMQELDKKPWLRVVEPQARADLNASAVYRRLAANSRLEVCG